MASSSMCGRPSSAASRRARVVLPDPDVPTTAMRIGPAPPEWAELMAPQGATLKALDWQRLTPFWVTIRESASRNCTS